MASKTNIEIILSAKDQGLVGAFAKARAAVHAFANTAGESANSIASMRSQVLQMAGAFAGLSAIADVAAMLKQADQNAYSLSASLKAANREFSVGSAADWEQTIAELSQKLRIYSESDIRGASARTVDMTKRLGLNAEQMKKVIELSGDLAAGRTDLEGGVERVTAALRGEAEAAEFLGLTLNENYVKGWYEASAAHEKAWKDLTDLEKAQVRYQVFLEQAIPLQGKAAESINTWSGALAYVRKEVADSIGKNADLAQSLQSVGETIRQNAPALGEMASKMATAAASVIQFVADNRELIADVAKWGAVFLAADVVIGRLLATWKGLNAAMTVMTGLQIIPWLRSIEAASAGTITALAGIKSGIIGLMGATASYFAGYKLGEWLTMREHIKGIASAQAELRTATAALSQKFKEVSQSTGMTITSMEQLDQLVKEGKVHYDQLTGTWVAGASEQQAATKQTAAVMHQATGEAIEAMKKKYQEYAQQIRQIQEQIAGRERSLAAELREMGRTGMSDYSSWKDRKKEAEEYAAAAKKAAQEAKTALAGGDTITADQKFKEAVQLADDAKNAYKQLNTEVKQGDQTLIGQQQALKTAMDGVKSSGELAIDILKQQQAAAKDAFDGMHTYEMLEKGIDSAEAKWLQNWKNMEQDASEKIKTVRERIDAMVEDRHVTIYVDTVERHALGGMVGLARGGKLAGYGGGDRIPAMLEAGEFVIRKEAVSRFGANIFHALNSLRLPELPKFATGGQVSPSEIHALSFDFGSGPVGQVTGSPVDVARIKKAFARSMRLRS